MPWGRLDDGLYDHPKVEALAPRLRNASVGLWARAISWSNRYLTDGRVTTERLRKLDGRQPEIDALIEVGLFESEGDGVRIHDFAEYNHTADHVREKRTLMREMGKRGGQASGEARRSSVAVERNGSTTTKRGAKRDGLNSRPVPSESRPRVNETDQVLPDARAADRPVDPSSKDGTPWL